MTGNITSFQARHGTLAYAIGAVTYDASTQLNDETFAADIAEVKDINVVLPEQEYEKIDCIGATAQTIGANAQTLGIATGVVVGKFQNQAKQRTASGTWMVSGTIVLTGNEQFVDLLGLGESTAITGATRYAVGDIDATTNATERNLLGALRFFLNNGSEEETVVLTNVSMKLGEISPTGADGHYERTFEAVCLAKDGAIEFLD